MLILVHPVTIAGHKFMPVTYDYATTMRRAQGATLDLVGLYFDRKRSDRGYGYVGASRAKKQIDVFLVGKVRRTDWRPVGEDARGGEQEYPSVLSETESEEATSSDFDMDDEDSDAESDDFQQDPADGELDEDSASEYVEEALRGCDKDIEGLMNDGIIDR